jgi:protein-disulfide isomerase
MSISQRVQGAATGVLAICAVVITTLAVWRELRPRTTTTKAGVKESVALPNWDDVARGGHEDGPAGAVVALVVFEDFECPACKYFATVTLPSVLADFHDQVRVVRRYSPLSYHRFAYPAARAAECAAAQGRFLEMHEVLFAKADSLGLKSFESYAREAGVLDTGAFQTCQGRTDSLPRVNADRNLAVEIGATGTPAVALNGRLYTGVPSADQLRGEIRRLIDSAAIR